MDVTKIVATLLLGQMLPLMAGLLVGSVAIGWLAGRPGSETRKAMALTTAVRNNGVGMVIATGSFAGTDAVTATAVYGMIGLLGALGFAVWWGRDGKIQVQQERR